MADDPTANEELLDRVIRHQVYLERFKTSELPKLIRELDALDDDLIAQLSKIDDPGKLSAQRLQALLDKVREISAEATKRYSMALNGTLQSFAEYEAAWTATQMAQAMGAEMVITAGLDLITPDPNLLRAAIKGRPLQGKLLKDWVSDLERGRYGRVAAAIRMAAIQSQTIQQLVQVIRGTQAAGFKDGLLNISRNGARALARTSIQHISNEARRLSFEANENVIKELRWVSTLDGRTTPFCRAMDGERLPLKSGPRPPAHINCRSTVVPVLKSWEELGVNAKELTPGTRASMNGQVPATLTYDQWLRKQSHAFQDDVLGHARAELFRNGVTVDKFVDMKTQHQFTLVELRTMEPDAWAATFGGQSINIGKVGDVSLSDDLKRQYLAEAQPKMIPGVLARKMIDRPNHDAIPFDSIETRDAWIAANGGPDEWAMVELYEAAGREWWVLAPDAKGTLVGVREALGAAAQLPLDLATFGTLEKAEAAVVRYMAAAQKVPWNAGKATELSIDGTGPYEHMAALERKTGSILFRSNTNDERSTGMPPSFDHAMRWDTFSKGRSPWDRAELDVWHNHPSYLSPLSGQDLVFAGARPPINDIVAQDTAGNIWRGAMPYFDNDGALFAHINRVSYGHNALWRAFYNVASREFDELQPVLQKAFPPERGQLLFGNNWRRDQAVAGYANHLTWRTLDALGLMRYRYTTTGLASELDAILDGILAEEGMTILDLAESLADLNSLKTYMRTFAGTWT